MSKEKAINLLKEIPDDMDYPTDEEFRRAFNVWYWDNVYPFLKSEEKKDGHLINDGPTFTGDLIGQTTINNNH